MYYSVKYSTSPSGYHDMASTLPYSSLINYHVCTQVAHTHTDTTVLHFMLNTVQYITIHTCQYYTSCSIQYNTLLYTHVSTTLHAQYSTIHYYTHMSVLHFMLNTVQYITIHTCQYYTSCSIQYNTLLYTHVSTTLHAQYSTIHYYTHMSVLHFMLNTVQYITIHTCQYGTLCCLWTTNRAHVFLRISSQVSTVNTQKQFCEGDFKDKISSTSSPVYIAYVHSHYCYTFHTNVNTHNKYFM